MTEPNVALPLETGNETSPRRRWVRLALALIVLDLVVLFLFLPGLRGGVSHVASRVFAAFAGEEEARPGYWYVCPMHLFYKKKQPGECGICAMSLVEMHESKIATDAGGRITISTRMGQLGGVRVETVRPRRTNRVLDTVGQVTYDEREVRVVTAWVGGRIVKRYVDFAGVEIHEGHALVRLYSPDILTGIEEYRLARARARAGDEESRIRVGAARRRLVRWGLTEAQVEKYTMMVPPPEAVDIVAPIGGTVVESLGALEGSWVKEGTPLYRIVPLQRVWVVAKVYEAELGGLLEVRPDDVHVCPMHPEVIARQPGNCPRCGMDLQRRNPGLRVEIHPRADPSRIFRGEVEFVDPVLDPKTRTARVRTGVDNEDGWLRPGMYVRVRIALPATDGIAVPVPAVLHAGNVDYVFVRTAPGTFEPRAIRVGPVAEGTDDRGQPYEFHPVLEGLEEGEEVVVTGNFLLSSEASLRGALDKLSRGTSLQLENPLAPEGDSAVDLSQAVREVLERAVRAYLEVEQLLAREKPGDISEAMARLLASIQQAGAVRGVTEEVKALLVPLEGAARTLVTTRPDPSIDLAENPSDDPRRQAFQALTRAVLACVDQLLPDLYGAWKLRKYECMMMRGAPWLDRDGNRTNPFYGPGMAEAGCVKRLR